MILLDMVEPVVRAMRVLSVTTSLQPGIDAHKDLISSLKLAMFIYQGCFIYLNAVLTGDSHR